MLEECLLSLLGQRQTLDFESSGLYEQVLVSGVKNKKSGVLSCIPLGTHTSNFRHCRRRQNMTSSTITYAGGTDNGVLGKFSLWDWATSDQPLLTLMERQTSRNSSRLSSLFARLEAAFSDMSSLLICSYVLSLLPKKYVIKLP
jgi:hypothetical protein